MSESEPREGNASTPQGGREEARPKRWLLWLVIPAGVAAALLLLVAVSGFLYLFSGQEVALSPEEKRLILDIEALSQWMEYSPNSSAATITKTRYLDGSVGIDYEYQDSEDTSTPYLSYSLNLERTAADATLVYMPMWAATKVGLGFSESANVSIQERNDLFRWGDASRFGLLKSNGSAFGNLFVARKGKTVVFCAFSGVYFDDTESIRQLLSPVLSRLDRYEP